MNETVASTPAPRVATSQSGHLARPVLRIKHAAQPRAEDDEIAVEVPIALEYNGLNHAVMLATPCDLVDLAYGFSYTEGIIRRAADIYDVEIVERPEGIVLQIEIASACLQQLKLRRRQIAGRTGCGLCGLDSLSEVRRDLPPVERRAQPLSSDIVLQAARNLFDDQSLHQVTGATHAAGWADHAGNILIVREDVGRHNALDKLIGAMLRDGINAGNGMAMISSRASFEMVQKAASAGISIIAAVSAPTSFAIRIANELNVCLAGFVRDTRLTVYTHAQHLGLQES